MSAPLLAAPAADLRAVVVIPAHDEAERIAGCLDALIAQEPLEEGSAEVLVVLDGCRDATGAEVAAARGRGLRAHAVPSGDAGPVGAGAARRLGMDLAAERLRACGRPDGLIASTDADSAPEPGWLRALVALTCLGAGAVAGDLVLDEREAAELGAGTLAARERAARDRLAVVRRSDPEAEHHHFAAANLGLTAEAYAAAGGVPPLAALEDEALLAALGAAGVAVRRSNRPVVRTSARTRGRAPRGLARDLALASWLERRRFVGPVDPDELLEAKGATSISVVLPARECAATIGGVLEVAVLPLLALGVVDEVLVVDAASRDATAEVARRAGARVAQQDELLAGHGPALGKGDAMWRGLAATSGELVAFLDADTADPRPLHLSGLLAPLLRDASISLVKGSFTRPFRLPGGPARPDEGGRVTELMARPLLNLHVPELAGFTQPLAGELAARRELLEALPFCTGYGVEVAMLIDALGHVGLDALAEAQLGSRQNRHQPLRDLGAMAYAVLAAVERRVRPGSPVIPGGFVEPWADGRVRPVPVLERPSLATLDRSDRRRGSFDGASAPEAPEAGISLDCPARAW